MFFYGVDATKKPTAAPLGADNTARFYAPQEENDPRAFFRMSRSAFSLVTSRLRRAISSCSGFIWPWPGNACSGSSANFFTQSRNCDVCTLRSCDAWAYDTPRSLISRTASSLNSRVNFRLSMLHLQLHQNTYLGVFGTGCRPGRVIFPYNLLTRTACKAHRRS